MDISPVFFYLFAGLAIACSAMVILKKNPVASAFNLVIVFFAFAAIYGMLGAHLVAALQVLVYAGAIMVLFALFVRVFKSSALLTTGPATSEAIAASGGNTKILSQMLFSEYILPFELTSVLLLGAIVGAVAIAKRKPAAGAAKGGRA